MLGSGGLQYTEELHEKSSIDFSSILDDDCGVYRIARGPWPSRDHYLSHIICGYRSSKPIYESPDHP